jgi:hypothetical protein
MQAIALISQVPQGPKKMDSLFVSPEKEQLLERIEYKKYGPVALCEESCGGLLDLVGGGAIGFGVFGQGVEPRIEEVGAAADAEDSGNGVGNGVRDGNGDGDGVGGEAEVSTEGTLNQAGLAGSGFSVDQYKAMSQDQACQLSHLAIATEEEFVVAGAVGSPGRQAIVYCERVHRFSFCGDGGNLLINLTDVNRNP